jgi:hypothetical protein
VPRFTEESIKRLCQEAVAARSTEDLHRVIADLRLALKEHMWFASESLKAHACTFPMLDSAKKQKETESKEPESEKRSS